MAFPCCELEMIDGLPYHSELCWRETDARGKPLVVVVLIGIFLSALVAIIVVLITSDVLRY